MTDFGPLLANPQTLLLGAAAQIGVFVALGGAMFLGFTAPQAAAIGIIGGADGPTSIYLAAKLAPELLGAIAVAAYSYMSLVPLIQPPVMLLFTTEKQRKIVMEQLRPVSHFEKVVFPIAATIFISLLLPSITALLGMLMFGNLINESGVTARLSDTAQNAMMNTVTIFLTLGTGCTMSAESFLNCGGYVSFEQHHDAVHEQHGDGGAFGTARNLDGASHRRGSESRSDVYRYRGIGCFCNAGCDTAEHVGTWTGAILLQRLSEGRYSALPCCIRYLYDHHSDYLALLPLMGNTDAETPCRIRQGVFLYRYVVDAAEENEA